MNWKVLGLGAALVTPLVWVLAQGFGRDPHALPDVMSGKQAPPFSLVTLDGDPVSLEALRGQPVVLNFWATWCGPCAQEHPYLLSAADAWKARGVVFLGVLYGDEPEKARAFLEKRGQAYPTLVDPDQHTAIDYGVAGVPETYFLDREGRIAYKATGPVTPDLVRSILERL